MLNLSTDDSHGDEAKPGTWWTAIEFISDLLILENIESWDETFVFAKLTAGGFSPAVTEAAVTWLQNASLQGRLQEIIGFIQERNIPRTRIENPAEGAFISNKLWKRLETMRLKGVVNLETMERLLAALRGLDCRDWEDAEVWDFVSQVVHRDKYPTSVIYDEFDGYAEPIMRPYC
jgi:hypothetical protein